MKSNYNKLIEYLKAHKNEWIHIKDLSYHCGYPPHQLGKLLNAFEGDVKKKIEPISNGFSSVQTTFYMYIGE